MVDIKNYRTGAEIALIVAFLISLGVNVSNKDEGYIPYDCTKEGVPDIMCYKLSKVNSAGIQSYCYYDREYPAKYKSCSTGWKRIVNVDEYQCEYDCPTQECSSLMVIAYTDNGKYFCDKIGPDAKCVQDNAIEMPFG